MPEKVIVFAALFATPVPPREAPSVADNPAAVPEVFWFQVGAFVIVADPRFHVPVGVYDPPSSRIVSAASRTVLVRLLEVRPVKDNRPD